MQWTTVIAPRTLGILIMVLFALQGVFTLLSPGSMRLQRPEGGLVPWVYNIVNLSTIHLLLTIPRLIPVEEAQLRQAYGEQYAAYSQRTRRLFPWVH